MWGRFYWGRREERAAGIAVIFAWLSSEERHLRHYIKLYGSLGWNSIVCHTDFLTLFFPEKATPLAHEILGQLLLDIKKEPVPVVFVGFSGGPKGCMFRILQIVNGQYEGLLHEDEYQLIRDCISGQIYDSSPVDFTSDLGTRFVLHPSVLKISRPPRVLLWMAQAVASGLDMLFLKRFEAQRAEYWKALYSSANMGPFLLFCSEDDDLAPYPVIFDFVQRIQELGGDVKVVKWKNSDHVGHFKIYPEEYSAAVTELLGKSTVLFSNRKRIKGGLQSRTGNPGGCNVIAKSIFDLQKAAMCSNESLRKGFGEPSDHFLLSSSTEYHDTKSAGMMQNDQKGMSFQLDNPPGINAHGVLGKILFDMCVPKNVEGWDIKPVGSLDSRQINAPSCRQGKFNPMKLIRRSRL